MNIEIIEETFSLIRPVGTQFANSFYQNLFLKYPEIQPLFAETNLEAQEKKLLVSLVLIIDNLRDLSYLKELLKNMGKRHVEYDVVSEYYPLVGEILLSTLQEYLGKYWTAVVKQAWTDAYNTIGDLMLEGAKEKHSLWNHSSQNITCTLQKLRVEAIAQKVLRETDSNEKAIQRMMTDSYFQKILAKLGQEKTIELIFELLENTRLKQEKNNTNNGYVPQT